MISESMTPAERRSALALAGIFSFRMLGLFMILPVFSLYAEGLDHVTPALIGMAIGIYGLTQALLQIPFGMASDRWGRKPVIAAGLLVFALGSVVAALSHTIEGIILGRALQGAGAVAAAVMALAADLTRDEHRTKAMAVIGMSIGLSFMVAMVAGPLLGGWIGVPGIFWLTSVLGLAGIALLYGVVPNPARSRLHRDTQPVPAQFARVLKDSQLLRLDFGILVLHMVLTASFVVMPLVLRDAGFAPAQHWQLYLPVMILAIAAVVPFILIAEKKRRMKEIMIGAVVLLFVSQLGLVQLNNSFAAVAVLMWVFFAGFNLLEALLPSLIAKLAPVESKGTAMGVYSSSQFVGAFIGGTAGGLLYGSAGFAAVFLFCAGMLALWLVFVVTMRQPPYLTTRFLRLPALDATQSADLEARIAAVKGVAEVVINVEDGMAYVKVDSQVLDAAALDRLVAVG